MNSFALESQTSSSTTDSSTSINVLQPTQTTHSSTQQTLTPHSASVVVGSTWSNINNLNINLDNLSLGSRSKPVTSAPTMNQLAGTPTSPLRAPTSGFPMVQPMYSPTVPQSAHFPAFK